MKEKELSGIIIILAILVFAITVGFVFERGGNGKKTEIDIESSVAQDLPTYTLEEVALHNVREDCWMVFNEDVFDFTSEFGAHPGGADTLLLGCGKDATELFESIHLPSTIEAGHNKFLVGKLK